MMLLKRRNLIILLGAGALTALAAAALVLFTGGNAGTQYRTETVDRGTIRLSVSATGTVNPVTTVLVGTQVSGTIKSIFVDFNSSVRKGQLIARIDPEIFEAQRAQAQANADRADAVLRDAARTWERMKALIAKNLIARNELDAAEVNAATAKAQADLAAAALASAETNLRYTKILSPVDGIVISRNVDVGQTVAASFQTPTLFTIAEDLTKMQINTNVDESDIGRVKEGMPVEFTVDAFPETNFTGRVRQVRRAPITVQNVVTYDVVINVDNPDLMLMPGMTANVSIILEAREDVVRIPSGALRFRLPGADRAGEPMKGPGVWTLDKGAPKRIPVQVGVSDGVYTELVAGELQEGRDVIVETPSKAKPAPRHSGPRMF